jgi:hypothetical protein
MCFLKDRVCKWGATCEVSSTGCGQRQDSTSLSMTDGIGKWHTCEQVPSHHIQATRRLRLRYFAWGRGSRKGGLAFRAHAVQGLSAQGPGGAHGVWVDADRGAGCTKSGKQGPICELLSERRSLTDKSIFSPSAVRSVSRLSSKCCFMQQVVAFGFCYSVTLAFRY